MKAEEFLKLAQELSEIDEPACLRTAVGRAYYATFNAARECQEAWELPFFSGNDSGRDHALIILRFIHSQNNDLSVAGNLMRELRSRRNDADYRLRKTNVEDRTKVQGMVKSAVRVISYINKWASESANSELVKTIQQWDMDNTDMSPQ